MSIKTTLVQNGTNEVTNQDIGHIQVIESENGILIEHRLTARERFFSEYSVFAVKTAQSTVEMCRVVYEAKSSLKESEFLDFCKDIGHKKEDATIRKYCRIGEQYDKLIQHTNLLPNSWTSIYTITQLPSETFDALAATDTDMSKLSGKQIKSLVDMSKPKSSTSTIKVAAAIADASTLETTADAQTSVLATSVSTQSEQAAADALDTPLDVTAIEATTALLERVNTHATTSVQVESEDEFKPYELVLQFKTKPSDEALWLLVECVNSIKSKFKVNIEINSHELVQS